jgi:hypothetical protein
MTAFVLIDKIDRITLPKQRLPGRPPVTAFIHRVHYKQRIGKGGMMSDRPCNYCHYQEIKRQARRDGLVVAVAKRPDGWVDVRTRRPGDKGDGKFLVSFAELTQTCAC